MTGVTSPDSIIDGPAQSCDIHHMTRPLRINTVNGWYHITSRGQNRRRIFDDKKDHAEFLARLGEMTKRYGVEIHAYVLMPNHYHLLLRTPKANVSQALQWLNNGYALWRNRRHGATGHVYQGRFRGILVEDGGWILGLSRYLHFNPVAVKRLGLGKQEKKAENLALKSPSSAIVKARLETLRRYPWSSYRAYAGYERAPEWLCTEVVLKRVEGGRVGYRRLAEDRMRQGSREDPWTKLQWGVALGRQEFARRVRDGARVTRETHGRKALRQEVTWEEVVEAVEKVKGEPWEDFVNRHGDWGRDIALWIARRRGGMTLKALGEKAGGMDYSAVSEAIRSLDKRRTKKLDLQRDLDAACNFLNLET